MIGGRAGMGRLVTTIGRGGRGRRRGRNCIEREAIRGGVETNWITARVGWVVVRGAQGDGGAPIVMARAWGVEDGRARFVLHSFSSLHSDFLEVALTIVTEVAEGQNTS